MVQARGRTMPKVVPRFGLGLILERAAVFFDDARGDGQAQAGAGFLGGEERVEQALLDLRGNAFAGVGRLPESRRVWSGRASRFSSSRARKVMVPFLPMLSAAFWMRLINTCLICLGSMRMWRGARRRRAPV